MNYLFYHKNAYGGSQNLDLVELPEPHRRFYDLS